MKDPTEPGFDPEATMATFTPRTGDIAPPPPKPAMPPSGQTPRQTGRTRNRGDDQPDPPFGVRRGNRIAYTINLPTTLARSLETAVANDTGTCSYGSIAVDAIRTHWRRLESTADECFPHRRITIGRLDRTAPRVRKVFYVTPEEADAIDTVRRRLGGIEVGQLHRLTLELYLKP